MNQDYGKITVRFAMTKGVGVFPDYSSWPKKNRTHAYLGSVMKFCPEFEQVEDVIADWKIIDNGLSGLSFTSMSLSGHPAPIVEFVLNEEVDADEFLHGVWTASYKLEIPGLNSEEPFFYEDHNGHAKIVSIERKHNLPGPLTLPATTQKL